MPAANDPSPTAPASGLGSKIPRERIDHAMQLWATGRSGIWCQQELRAKWKVSTRQARRYLEVARARLQRIREQNPSLVLAPFERAELQLQAAYDVAAEKRDAKAMVLAASRLGELAGVLGTQRIELSGKNGVPLVPVNIQLRWPDERDDSAPTTAPEAT